ncbi:MAG TPA: hypothetical protein VGC20_11695 [bacterium]|jgi:hypothetical protein
MTGQLPIRAASAASRRLVAGVALAWLLGWASLAPAQAPAVPGQAPAVPGAAPGAAPAPAPAGGRLAAGDMSLRIHLDLIDQLSFAVHPFYQITGDGSYLTGKAATVLLLRIRQRDTDEKSNALTKAIHALPPFGIEGVMGIDLPFPRGLGIGFNFTPLPEKDTDAADGGLPIKMDVYLYTGSLRFYFFDPNEPGVNYFVGLGLGLLEGNIKAEPFIGVPAEFVSFSQYPVGSTRMGLESRGENWGFRYELEIINADQVKLSSNPYTAATGVTTTEIDFSGSLVRLSLFYQF